mgnify:CR=1 FL=1
MISSLTQNKTSQSLSPIRNLPWKGKCGRSIYHLYEHRTKHREHCRVIDAWFMDKIRTLEQLLRQGRIPKKALDDLKLARSNRLRQIVSHVFNIEKLLRYAFKPEEVRRMKTLMSNNSDPSILAQLKNTKGKRLQGLMKYEEGFRIISSFKDPMFGGSFDIDKLFGILEKDAYINKFQCAKCDKRPPEDPYIETQVSTVPLLPTAKSTNSDSVNMLCAARVLPKSFKASWGGPAEQAMCRII